MDQSRPIPKAKIPGNPIHPRSREDFGAATPSEIRARVHFVMDMLATGWKKGEIKEFFRKEYGIHFRQVERYIRRARDQMVKRALKTDHDTLVAESYGFYLSVLKNPGATQKEKIEARRRADELLGLTAPKKIAPTTPDGKNPYKETVKTLSTEQLELLAKLKERSSDLATGTGGCSAN